MDEKTRIVEFSLSILCPYLLFWGSWPCSEEVKEEEEMNEKDVKKIPIVRSVWVAKWPPAGYLTTLKSNQNYK